MFPPFHHTLHPLPHPHPHHAIINTTTLNNRGMNFQQPPFQHPHTPIPTETTPLDSSAAMTVTAFSENTAFLQSLRVGDDVDALDMIGYPQWRHAYIMECPPESILLSARAEFKIRWSKWASNWDEYVHSVRLAPYNSRVLGDTGPECSSEKEASAHLAKGWKQSRKDAVFTDMYVGIRKPSVQSLSLDTLLPQAPESLEDHDLHPLHPSFNLLACHRVLLYSRCPALWHSNNSSLVSFCTLDSLTTSSTTNDDSGIFNPNDLSTVRQSYNLNSTYSFSSPQNPGRNSTLNNLTGSSSNRPNSAQLPRPTKTDIHNVPKSRMPHENISSSLTSNGKSRPSKDLEIAAAIDALSLTPNSYSRYTSSLSLIPTQPTSLPHKSVVPDFSTLQKQDIECRLDCASLKSDGDSCARSEEAEDVEGELYEYSFKDRIFSANGPLQEMKEIDDINNSMQLSSLNSSTQTSSLSSPTYSPDFSPSTAANRASGIANFSFPLQFQEDGKYAGPVVLQLQNLTTHSALKAFVHFLYTDSFPSKKSQDSDPNHANPPSKPNLSRGGQSLDSYIHRMRNVSDNDVDVLDDDLTEELDISGTPHPSTEVQELVENGFSSNLHSLINNDPNSNLNSDSDDEDNSIDDDSVFTSSENLSLLDIFDLAFVGTRLQLPRLVALCASYLSSMLTIETVMEAIHLCCSQGFLEEYLKENNALKNSNASNTTITANFQASLIVHLCFDYLAFHWDRAVQLPKNMHLLHSLPFESFSVVVNCKSRTTRPASLHANGRYSPPMIQLPPTRLVRDLKQLYTARLSPSDAQDSSNVESSVPCDFSIEVSGKTIWAHKAVLAARADFFAALFRTSMNENEKRHLVLDDERYCFESIEATIQHIYTHELNHLTYKSALDLSRHCTSFFGLHTNDLEQASERLLLSTAGQEQGTELIKVSWITGKWKLFEKAVAYLDWNGLDAMMRNEERKNDLPSKDSPNNENITSVPYDPMLLRAIVSEKARPGRVRAENEAASEQSQLVDSSIPDPSTFTSSTSSRTQLVSSISSARQYINQLRTLASAVQAATSHDLPELETLDFVRRQILNIDLGNNNNFPSDI